MGKIMLVEDDYYLAKNLNMVLSKEGYETKIVSSISEAKEVLAKEHINLCLVDVCLPDGSGLELCSYICNESGKRCPVLIISACDNENTVIDGLERGAYDYIIKPFRPRELMSRIKANLRRMENTVNTKIYTYGDISVDIDKQQVTKQGDVIVLRKMEYELLEMFIKNAELVLKRDAILGKLWDDNGDFVEDNTLSVLVKRLREKLGKKPDGSDYIETIRGVGYRFN